MDRQGLIIGIDYSSEYCQVCFYSMRHKRPESITAGRDEMRYLIPVALSYDVEKSDWIIGNEALDYASATGASVYGDFLTNTLGGGNAVVGNSEFSYKQLFAVYISKLIGLVQQASFAGTVSNITVTLRRIRPDIKEAFVEVFALLGVNEDRLKLLSYSESFAYFVMSSDEELRKKGVLLFDFSTDGFFVKQIKEVDETDRKLIYVNESMHSFEFSMKDLSSNMAKLQLDEKLNTAYQEIAKDNMPSAVYFSGDGFTEIWFANTLQSISEKAKAFKGNNIYVKGACLAGCRRAAKQPDLIIVSKDRTKARIAVDAFRGDKESRIVLADGAKSWYDAGCSVDFIVDNLSWIKFYVTSVISKETTVIEFDLSEFPKRPNKTTRIEINLNFINDSECMLGIKDKGFGEMFASSGIEFSKRLSLERII